MSNKNSILLFGDYGTEVVRKTQIYDPENCMWQPVGADEAYNPRATYAVATIRNKAVHFDDVTASLATAGGFAAGTRYFRYVPEKADVPQGMYVPVPKTLVVVDESSEYSQYTLMAVDWVEDGTNEDKIFKDLSTEDRQTYIPTYKSHLKPINFTGGIDQATRVVDYNNDRLMLYVEDIDDPNHPGQTIQRLVPDRKLMMYGPRHLCYSIRLSDDGDPVNTNTLLGAHSEDQEVSDYVPAMSKPVQVDNADQYAGLVGCLIRYYNSKGELVTEEYDGTASQQADVIASYKSGRQIYIVTNSDDTLTQVQIPDACYLRSSVGTLTPESIVTMDVYEPDEASETLRPIVSVKLHVRTGSSLNAADLTKGTIVGFGVCLGSSTEETDVWTVTTSTSSEALLSNISPYLLLDSGEKQSLPVGSEGLMIYGLEQLDKSLMAGSTFEILFKYFPYAGIDGMSPTYGVNTRYAVTSDTTPSAVKQYFVRESGEWKLAGGTGSVSEFAAGTTYYEKIMAMNWNGVVSRPSRDFLICKKRITVSTGLSSGARTINHITPVPIWDIMTESWDFKFLVYFKDYSVPKLLSETPSNTGYVVVNGAIPYGEPPKTDTICHAEVFYKPSIAAAHYPEGRQLHMQVRDFGTWPYTIQGNYTLKNERWLIGGAGTSDGVAWSNSKVPYGRHGSEFGRIRPVLECWTEVVNGRTVAKFQVPTKVFPNLTDKNTFLENFYRAALDDDDTWAAQVEPNCFRIRAVEPGVIDGVTVPADDIVSDYFVIDEGVGSPMSYGLAFECNGIRIPSDPNIEKEYYDIDGEMVLKPQLPSIVIMEFAYSSNGQILTLMGVPVEVYRIAKNPSEV